MTKLEERDVFVFKNKNEKLFGIMHRPLKVKKAPAVIFCQGFEGNKCGRLNLYVALAQELTKNGIITIRFDYRGDGDSEGDSNFLTIQDKISDTLALLDYLKKDPLIDANRIGIFGRSLGGAVAVLSASTSNNIKSLALWAPVYNGVQWLELYNNLKAHPNSSSVQAEIKKIPGSIPNEKFMQELFKLDLTQPLTNLKTVPLLHIHGDKDSVIKPYHAEAFKKMGTTFNKYKHITLNDTDHDIAFSPDKQIAFDEIVEWFKTTL